MNTLKFTYKAKTLDHTEWVYGDYHSYETFGYLAGVKHLIGDYYIDISTLCVGVPDAEDVNGKRIYLNDIVLLNDGLFKVVWEKDQHGFVYHSLLVHPTHGIKKEKLRSGGKIVGNVHNHLFRARSFVLNIVIYGDSLNRTGTCSVPEIMLNGQLVHSSTLQLLHNDGFVDYEYDDTHNGEFVFSDGMGNTISVKGNGIAKW